MDDAWTSSLAFLLANVPVLGRLHVRYHSLTEMERSCEVRLDIGLPLSTRVEVVHGFAVLPEGAADSAIVDQDISAVVEEGRCFLGCFTDVVDAAKIA